MPTLRGSNRSTLLAAALGGLGFVALVLGALTVQAWGRVGSISFTAPFLAQHREPLGRMAALLQGAAAAELVFAAALWLPAVRATQRLRRSQVERQGR